MHSPVIIDSYDSIPISNHDEWTGYTSSNGRELKNACPSWCCRFGVPATGKRGPLQACFLKINTSAAPINRTTDMKVFISSAGLLLTIAILVMGCLQYPAPPAAPPTSLVPAPTETAVPLAPVVTTATVAPPGPLTFVPGGIYHAGDHIVISGKTILSPGNRILVEITSASFGPANKSAGSEFYGATGIVTVQPGAVGLPNTWSFDLDTATLAPDMYQVLVEGITVKTYRESTSFTLLPRV
jgi:hypothetical protein